MKNKFQSTRPVRGATVLIAHILQLLRVSIHAPREGRDPYSNIDQVTPCSFNPRAP